MKSQVVAATAAEASEKEHRALNDRAFKRRRIRKERPLDPEDGVTSQ